MDIYCPNCEAVLDAGAGESRNFLLDDAPVRILMGMRTIHANVSRFILALTVLLTPTVAWAQSAPTPSVRNSPEPWIGLLAIFFLLAIVVAVSLLPSKRGHQD